MLGYGRSAQSFYCAVSKRIPFASAGGGGAVGLVVAVDHAGPRSRNGGGRCSATKAGIFNTAAAVKPLGRHGALRQGVEDAFAAPFGSGNPAPLGLAAHGSRLRLNHDRCRYRQADEYQIAHIAFSLEAGISFVGFRSAAEAGVLSRASSFRPIVFRIPGRFAKARVTPCVAGPVEWIYFTAISARSDQVILLYSSPASYHVLGNTVQ
jgi:hypothetical protein